MYDPRNLLKQEPITITEFLKAVIACLVIFGVVHWDAKETAAVLLVASLFLNLIYVRSASTPTAKFDELAKFVQTPAPAKAAPKRVTKKR